MSQTSSSRTHFLPRLIRYGIAAIVLAVVLGGGAWFGLVTVTSRFEKACKAAQAEQRWDDLESTARRWTNLLPTCAPAWVFLADAAQHQKRYVEAAEYLGNILPHQTEYFPSQMARIKLLFGPANLPFQAEEVCQEYLRNDPSDREVHTLLIQFYTVTLQRTKLRQQIAAAIQAGAEPPDAYIYYFLIDSVRLGNGVSLNSLWLTTNPDNEILEVASILHDEDRVRDGDEPPSREDVNILTVKENQARQMLNKFPHNANLLAYLADQELSKGRVEKVIELMTQTLSDTEADPRFWRFKGWIHFTLKEYTEAEKAYQKAISLHAMDWLTLHRLAEVKRVQGDLAEVNRLESLVEKAHGIRMVIRELKTVLNPPMSVLQKIGRLARGVGDQMIADALEARLGPLGEDPPAATPDTTSAAPVQLK